MKHKLFCKQIFLSVFILSLATLFSSGCSSIVRGGSEKVSIQTSPSGAEVKLSTGQYGITPFDVRLKRKETVYVTITKPGYKEVQTALISSIDGASLGIGTAANFLFFPIVNDIVDYNTGANYSHKPNPLIVTLIPVTSTEDYKYVAPPSTPTEKVDTKPTPAQPTQTEKTQGSSAGSEPTKKETPPLTEPAKTEQPATPPST